MHTTYSLSSTVALATLAVRTIPSIILWDSYAILFQLYVSIIVYIFWLVSSIVL